MDDARLANEMTLENIAKRLDSIQADLGSMRSELADVKTEMRDGFNASKIRDEELRALAKLGREANQGLLETTTARFDDTDKRHAEEISLLTDVLRNQIASAR